MHDNLSRAYPQLTVAERTRIAKRSWANLILTCCELVRFPTHLPEMLEAMPFTGFENVQAALAQGKGVLIITAHSGNWEMAGAWLAQRHPTTVVARPMNQSSFAADVNACRESGGMKVLARKNALKGVLSALRRNEIVAVMFDQHAGKNGVEVAFFNRPVSAFSSVAYLALKTGAPVVPGLSYRDADDRLRVIVTPEIPLVVTGDETADLVTNTQHYISALEEMIRVAPETWMWMHRRWRKS